MSVAPTCQQCGATSRPGDQFCRSCGEPFAPTAPPPAGGGKRGFPAALLIAAVAVVLLGGGAAYYFTVVRQPAPEPVARQGGTLSENQGKQQSSASSETPPAKTETPPKQQQALPPATPKQASGQPAKTKANPPPGMATKARYRGEPAGLIVWTGQIGQGETLTIIGSRASFGTLQGELPGVPVELEFDDQEFETVERPRKENGWKRLEIRPIGRSHNLIPIRWTVVD